MYGPYHGTNGICIPTCTIKKNIHVGKYIVRPMDGMGCGSVNLISQDGSETLINYRIFTEGSHEAKQHVG